jgi:hypothetical protein
VYLANPSGTWQVVDMACGSTEGFAPAVKSVITLQASGSCGRVRKTVSLSATVVRCLPNGTRIMVTGAPEYGDGDVWWPIADTTTSGFVAQELVVDPAAQVPAKH